jgi:hypothetical protein
MLNDSSRSHEQTRSLMAQHPHVPARQVYGRRLKRRGGGLIVGIQRLLGGEMGSRNLASNPTPD